MEKQTINKVHEFLRAEYRNNDVVCDDLHRKYVEADKAFRDAKEEYDRACQKRSELRIALKVFDGLT